MGIISQDAVLAADAGGTHCRMALVSGGARHDLTLGPANVWADFDGAVAMLRGGLEQLAERAGMAPAAVKDMAGFLGLAGVIDNDSAARVRAALGLSRAEVGSDRQAAVAGALGGQDGALAGLGTGSFFALQSAGGLRLAGGWGAQLSDDGSGYWLGREALRALLDFHDGLISGSPLITALIHRLGERPGPVLEFGRTAGQAGMAALAPMVSAAAEAGDPVARGILKRGAETILDMLRRLGWDGATPLCLIGGVAPAYVPFLPPSVRHRMTAPRASALEGAISLARERRR